MKVLLLSLFLFFSGCGSAFEGDNQRQAAVQQDAGNNLSDRQEACDSPECQVLEITNRFRAEAGCPALRMNNLLSEAAFRHSKDMDDRNYFGHELKGDPSTKLGARVQAVGYRFSAAGENIAAGHRSPREVMNGWMNSPGHRANILNCNFRELGVGIHGQRPIFWTQIFGRPR